MNSGLLGINMIAFAHIYIRIHAGMHINDWKKIIRGAFH